MIKNRNIIILALVIFFVASCKEKEEVVTENKVQKKLTYREKLKLSFLKGNYLNNYKEVRRIAFYYNKLNKPDSSIYYLKNFLESNKKISSEQLGVLLYRLGVNYKKINSIEEAYNHFIKSKEEYLKIGDSVKVGEKLFSIAKIESDKELYYKSNSTLIEALNFLDPKNSYLLSSIYNTLGINNNAQKKYGVSNEWYEKAIGSTDNGVKKLRYFNNIANNYRGLKEYNKSLKYYKMIISNLYYDSIPLDLKGKIIDNYVFTKFKNKERVKVEDFLKAQRIKREVRDSIALIANYSHLSDYYLFNNKKQSLVYANKMYNLAQKLYKPDDQLEALDKKIKLVNNGNEQIKLFEERISLSDSIQKSRENSKNQFALYVYNYEKERKEKLKAQINAEQHKSQKQQWIFIGLTSIIGFIIYFFYKREKTKKEKVIEVYKTETRLAKKIHDELANDVYLAMNKVQQGNTGESLLLNLEKIYTQTRNISHENSPVLTGNQFEEYVKQLFQDFTTDQCRVMSKDISKIQINKLSKEKQIVMYRVLQELLVNMKKYSNASLVVVGFAQEKENIHITYKDNGIGVNTLNIKNGLQNMETRIKSIGGSITFETRERKGFQAKFQFKK